MRSVVLPLVEVENTNEKIVLDFVDENKMELYDVIWNKYKYDPNQGKMIPDKAKELEVADWCQKYLGVPIENVQDAEGQEHEVFIGDGFNSLWKTASKFNEDMYGETYTCEITDIDADDKDIEIFYDIDGDTYSTHMRYTVRKNGRQLINPQKRIKQQRKFEELFKVPVEEAKSVIGKKILVECKKAFNFYYGEIKKMK